MNAKKPLLIACLGLAVTLQAECKTNRPNFVIFVADDMGYGDVGFTGCKDIKTPNLDKLAASGVIFTSGYSNHGFCAPSRAALLSGQYPYRFGFETNPAYDTNNPYMGISTEITLFPKRLQEVGYKTGAIGKWHLGAAEMFNPLNRGFDYFYGFLGGGHDYFKIDVTKKVDEAYLQPLQRNNKPATFDGYITTALSRDAAQFVSDNKANPFFLYVAYNAPHQPLQAPEEDIDRYSQISDPKRRVYAAMVDVMDRGIGEVIAALKSNGLYENTFIFFMSDNGGPLDNGSLNTPFRGRKGDFYDGGVHVPFIVSWPEKIKKGSVYKYPVNSLDISRTIVEMAEADPTKGSKMEGVNLTPYLTGEKKEAPHQAIFWRGGNGNQWAILASDLTKLIQNRNSDGLQLFSLPNDISESKNIIKEQAQRSENLRSDWDEWNKQNVPCNMPGYKEYHEMRNKFFKSAIPGNADKE